jgi:hypothetical protein
MSSDLQLQSDVEDLLSSVKESSVFSAASDGAAASEPQRS